MTELQAKESASIPKSIVFVQTKNVAYKVFASLRNSANDREYISMYHASLTQHTKEYIRTGRSSKLRCLVATVAFGMVSYPIVGLIAEIRGFLIFKGMDIPYVELVIVYGAPKSMSQLNQVNLRKFCT